MKNRIFKFLKSYSTNPNLIDRLIVSSYLTINNVVVLNNFLIRECIIYPEQESEHFALQSFLDIINADLGKLDFEDVIELFEFVISPSDKVVNGAVYTPDVIREYIVDQSISIYGHNIDNVMACDISCGCGGFLLTLTKKIREITDKSYGDIFKDNIFGIDIAEYSIERAKLLLTLLALSNHEDIENYSFNLHTGNSLIFNWRTECDQVNYNGGFDIIVGNPPYVCSRNMDAETLVQVKEWEVAKTGHPDLYIPFFQIGVENLNNIGILGYITVNTFIKSINGRAVREYFSRKDINLTILNFGGEQIFQDRNTYTCICFLKFGNPEINYSRIASREIAHTDINNLRKFNYIDLNHQDGWNLANDDETVDFINAVESVGIRFKDLYKTKNGIATLKNDVFKFKIFREDKNFFYLNDGNNIYPIERSICRDIVNANKIKSLSDITIIKEKIIFPYDQNTQIINEKIMLKKFPNAYKYLESRKDVLSTRDKGNRQYEKWYAYGRKQSMDIVAHKLFFPHICEKPNFVLCNELDLLFYNGIAIVSEDLNDLMVIKKIMESKLFFKYIKNVTKDYASGYISMSRNHLKNFGVYQFSENERTILLGSDNVDEFLEELYGISIASI
jgi:adenine-specific DNA-methyltransferase